jgi:WD40 repeat protein
MSEPKFLHSPPPPRRNPEPPGTDRKRPGIWAIAVSPEDRLLAAGLDSGAVAVWVPGLVEANAVSPAPFLSGEGHTQAVRSVSFSPVDAVGPEGPYHVLASGSSDGTVRTWHLDNDSRNRVFDGHDSSVMCVAYSPSGKQLASGSEDRTIIIRDLDADTECRINGHDGTVLCLAFSPSGETFVSGGFDGALRLRHAHDGTVIRELHPGGMIPSIWNAEFNRDGDRVVFAAGGLFGTWDLARDEIVDSWNDPLGRRAARVYAASCRPDGAQYAASFGHDAALLSPGERNVDLRRAHAGEVHTGAYFSCGRLATGGADGMVYIWETRKHTTKPLFHLEASSPVA